MNEEKREVSLTPTRMKPAEYNRTVYSISIEHGITKEDMSQPKFWAHVASSLRPYDRIEAFAEDGSFYSELLVIACDRTWARVQLLSYHDLTKVTMDLGAVFDEYLITFKGPKGWCVIRKSDNSVLNDKMLSEEDGKKWLEVHLRKRAA